jgi:predicted dehydrogenase
MINRNRIVKIGIVGCGYWGSNLIRNFLKIPNCEITGVVDIDGAKIKNIKKSYPNLNVNKDINILLKNEEVEGIVIATPVSTHYSLAREALINRKHVLVEKPLAQTVRQAIDLIRLSESKNKIIMVDSTFIYSDAVQKLKKIIEKGDLGQINYIDSTRANLGIFQKDINALWDLAPHDFSIFNYVLKEKPIAICAFGIAPIVYKKKLESIIHVLITFEKGIVAHIFLSWLSPVKIRQMTFIGSKKMLVYDHLNVPNQIKIYNKSVKVFKYKKEMIQYYSGRVETPKIDQTEPLQLVCQHFIKCIRENKQPLTNGKSELKVVELLEKAQESLRLKGKWIKI